MVMAVMAAQNRRRRRRRWRCRLFDIDSRDLSDEVDV